MSSTSTKYGLILNKRSLTLSKIQPVLSDKLAVFDEDKDSADSTTEASEKSDVSSLKYGVHANSRSAFLKYQVQGNIEKALSEDPTVFDYDAVYDDMKSESQVKMDKKYGTESNKCKESRYIGGLLRAAEQRKREQERRMEKSIQKERLKEADQFSDTESFVTGAYRDKLKRIKEEEERERQQLIIEEKNDVTKQADLTQFYRNLLSTSCDPSKEKRDQRETSSTKSEQVNTSEDAFVEEDIDDSSKNLSSVIQSKAFELENSMDEKLCAHIYHKQTPSEEKTEYEKGSGKIRSKGHDRKRLRDEIKVQFEEEDGASIDRRSTDAHEISEKKFKENESFGTKITVNEPVEIINKCNYNYRDICNRNKSSEELVSSSMKSVTNDSKGKSNNSKLQYSRRNVGQALNEAKAKYLARKQAVVSTIMYGNEDDNK